MIFIGTAGWSLPAPPARQSPGQSGSHLHHYARMLPCTEINSTFYRAHRRATWERWAADTPPDFRFSVKAPRTITHEARLRDAEPLLRAFLEQLEPLGAKCGPLLFQLPPRLECDTATAENFFQALRNIYSGDAVVEPRHGSWFTAAVDAMLVRHRIARAAADPARACPAAAYPGGWSELVYYRLHGSPRMYYSPYSGDDLATLAAALTGANRAWIIFDNTAARHAFPNAVELLSLVDAAPGSTATLPGPRSKAR